MAERLKCGHNVSWVLRLVDGEKKKIYCLGCLVEKIGLEDIYATSISERIESRKKKV